MKINFYELTSGKKIGLLAGAMTLQYGIASAQVTHTFVFTAAVQTIALTPGNYEIECWGADGGSLTANTALPGKGGYSKGEISISAPATFSIYVGGKGSGGAQPLGGYNSGNGTTKTNLTTATGGGGASDVRVLADDIYNRIIVAGGGGGQGTSTGTGGNGGGVNGQNGQGTTNAGVGGTQTAPGLYPGGGDAKPADFGEGGDGPAGTTGGQGGGGWYGGSFGTRTNGGGAGGSGYVLTPTSFTPVGYFAAHPNYYFTNDVTLRADEAGFVPNPDLSGNGLVLIRELCSISLSVAGLNSSGAICAGEVITISTDAVSNYTWTDGSIGPVLVAAPATSTVYGLTAMSPSNCIASAQVSVTVNPLPVLNATTTANAICLGESVTLTSEGADTYSWSSGATSPFVTLTPNQTTTYSITGTHTLSGCESTDVVTVNVLKPTVSIIGNSVICKGNTTTLTAFGDGAMFYNWSTGSPGQSIIQSPSSHSIYAVTANVSTLNVTCSALSTFTVLVNPLPDIFANPDRFSVCLGETVEFSATGGVNYAWSWQSATSNAPTFVIDAEQLFGEIAVSVTGTDANGCSRTVSATTQVYACTGINETLSANEIISVYPNPSQGNVSITVNPAYGGGQLELRMLNETGQLIRTIILNEENGYRASLSELNAGLYFLAGNNGGRSITGKVIIVR